MSDFILESLKPMLMKNIGPSFEKLEVEIKNLLDEINKEYTNSEISFVILSRPDGLIIAPMVINIENDTIELYKGDKLITPQLLVPYLTHNFLKILKK